MVPNFTHICGSNFLMPCEIIAERTTNYKLRNHEKYPEQKKVIEAFQTMKYER